MHKKLRSETGAVLIQTLFIVLIITMIATTIGIKLFLNLRAYNIYQEVERMVLAAPYAQYWAENKLKKPAALSADNPVATLSTTLTSLMQPITLQAQLIDLQAKFNLNNLTDPAYQHVFLRLLQSLSPELSISQAKEISQRIVNYLSFESSFEQKYSPTNTKDKARRWFVSPSELRVLARFNDTLYDQLLPHISALPEVTPININTASEQLLAAVIENINIEQMQTLLTKRQEKAFEKLEDVSKQNSTLKLNPNALRLLTTVSKYFLVETNFTSKKRALTTLTVVKKQSDKPLAALEVIQNTLNTL